MVAGIHAYHHRRTSTRQPHHSIPETQGKLSSRREVQIRGPEGKTRLHHSGDTKKKELVGDFKNGGREYQREGEPEKVRVHDFKDPALGKAIPYGVYDVARNEGWVNVGTDHDTSTFAVESIRRWWLSWSRSATRMPRN